MTTSKGKVTAMNKIILTLMVLLSWGAAAASAAPLSPLTMTLSSGGQTVTITDETLGGDLNPTAGSMLYMGTVGNFTISLASGISYPAYGGANLAVLNLSNLNV